MLPATSFTLLFSPHSPAQLKIIVKVIIIHSLPRFPAFCAIKNWRENWRKNNEVREKNIFNSSVLDNLISLIFFKIERLDTSASSQFLLYAPKSDHKGRKATEQTWNRLNWIFQSDMHYLHSTRYNLHLRFLNLF